MNKYFKPKTYKGSKKSWTNFRALCKSCGTCLEICPTKALKYGKDLAYYGQPAPDCNIKKCIACKLCEINCPDSAIRVDKK